MLEGQNDEWNTNDNADDVFGGAAARTSSYEMQDLSNCGTFEKISNFELKNPLEEEKNHRSDSALNYEFEFGRSEQEEGRTDQESQNPFTGTNENTGCILTDTRPLMSSDRSVQDTTDYSNQVEKSSNNPNSASSSLEDEENMATFENIPKEAPKSGKARLSYEEADLEREINFKLKEDVKVRE